MAANRTLALAGPRAGHNMQPARVINCQSVQTAPQPPTLLSRHADTSFQAGHGLACLPICSSIGSIWTDQSGTPADASMLSRAVPRSKSLADMEEVTGSNPVSPTSITPSQPGIRAVGSILISERESPLLTNAWPAESGTAHPQT